MRERLSANELRNVEEGTYLVAYLRDEEYYEMGEGEVQWLRSEDSGRTVIRLRNGRGYESDLIVPADARTGLELSALSNPRGRGLKVERVVER